MINPKKNLQLENYMERLIEKEVDAALLEEDMVDWVKQKMQAAGSVVQAGWQKLSGQAKKIFGTITNELANVQKKITASLPKVNAEYQAVVKAFSENGGDVKSVPGMSEMQALVQASTAFSTAAVADAQQVKSVVQQTQTQQQQQQMQTQQQQQQQTQQQPMAQESFIPFLEASVLILREVSDDLEFETLLFESDELSREKLDEIDPGSMAAIALASPKLIMWLLGFMRFVAKRFDSNTAWTATVALTKAQNWIYKTEHVLIDKGIPNKVAFGYYVMKTGVKTQLGLSGRSEEVAKAAPTLENQVVSLEQFVANDKVRMITKIQMHKILVMGLLGNSSLHLLHGIRGIISGMDIAASVAKVAELGTEGAEVLQSLGPLASATADVASGGGTTK